MKSLLIVKLKILMQAILKFSPILIGFQIYILVLDTAPEPFYENIINGSAFAIPRGVRIEI
jgi:hypothetical protein